LPVRERGERGWAAEVGVFRARARNAGQKKAGQLGSIGLGDLGEELERKGKTLGQCETHMPSRSARGVNMNEAVTVAAPTITIAVP
jgi:hypothetical protein